MTEPIVFILGAGVGLAAHAALQYVGSKLKPKLEGLAGELKADHPLAYSETEKFDARIHMGLVEAQRLSVHARDWADRYAEAAVGIMEAKLRNLEADTKKKLADAGDYNVKVQG